MDGGLAAAVRDLREAFAGYSRRPVLEGCPHCAGPVVVAEHDLFALTISLGNTVGTGDDVKSLLPMLLERLVTDDDLDPGIVLSKLVREDWGSWPAAERQAVDNYLLAVWRSLLAEYPARVGAFHDTAEFLAVAGQLDDSARPWLHAWDALGGPAADRHLANLVIEWVNGARVPAAVVTWLRREQTRNRLSEAFTRDHSTGWADDLAQAHDLVASTGT